MVVITAIALSAWGVILLRQAAVSDGGNDGIFSSLSVEFYDPARIDNDVWSVEVSNVVGHHDPDVEHVEEFSIWLKMEDSVVVSFQQLRNGLVAHSGNITIFFEDNGKHGRLDAGDSFHMTGLDPGSHFELWISNRFFANVGSVSLQT